jgi:hypothetical protein
MFTRFVVPGCQKRLKLFLQLTISATTRRLNDVDDGGGKKLERDVISERFKDATTIGQMTIGQMTIGQMTIGQMTIGQMTIGQMIMV